MERGRLGRLGQGGQLADHLVELLGRRLVAVDGSIEELLAGSDSPLLARSQGFEEAGGRSEVGYYGQRSVRTRVPRRARAKGTRRTACGNRNAGTSNDHNPSLLAQGMQEAIQLRVTVLVKVFQVDVFGGPRIWSAGNASALGSRGTFPRERVGVRRVSLPRR